MNSIVVVGAGFAGLSCAWKLRRAGHEVEVLEARLLPGGRTRSEIRDGFTLESETQAQVDLLPFLLPLTLVLVLNSYLHYTTK